MQNIPTAKHVVIAGVDTLGRFTIPKAIREATKVHKTGKIRVTQLSDNTVLIERFTPVIEKDIIEKEQTKSALRECINALVAKLKEL